MTAARNVVLAVALLGGCDLTIGDEPTRGELGRAEMAYDEGIFGCLFGCDASEPMAARAVAILDVLNAEELPPFDVATEDASILEAELLGTSSSSIRATSHAAGETGLLLVDGSGATIDRFRRVVRDVASIEVAADDLFVERLTVFEGGEIELGLTLRDDRRRRLKGIGAVDYRLEGEIDETRLGLVDALAEAIVSIFAGSVTEHASLTALGPGSGSIVVTAPTGASLTIPVAVVDESAVTAIRIAPRDQPEAGSGMIVDALAEAGVEPVHAPLCAWQVSPTDGPVQVDWMSDGTIQLSSDVPASITVTCTIGAVSGTGVVTFVAP